MASDFLKKLQNAVDKGEFNSEAAKKIIEIDNETKTRFGNGGNFKDITKFEHLVNKRLEKSGIKTVSEEEAILANLEAEETMSKIEEVHEKEIAELNSSFELKQQEIKEKELVLNQIKLLNEIEDSVKLTISDMFEFVQQLEESFDVTKDCNKELFVEINKINEKYKKLL